jgi:hypothetical protein
MPADHTEEHKRSVIQNKCAETGKAYLIATCETWIIAMALFLSSFIGRWSLAPDGVYCEASNIFFLMGCGIMPWTAIYWCAIYVNADAVSEANFRVFA